VYPYHKNLQIFVCPNRPEWDASNSCITGGYAVNGRIVRHLPPPVPEAVIVQPADTMLLLDSYASHDFIDNWAGLPGLRISPDTNAEQTCRSLPLFNLGPCGQDCCQEIRRHQGGINVCFYDGHVKWLPPARIQQRMFTVEED
jgi:prepilin-type processing-associated H-X9-DG protein